jgi:hypothetical protein
MPMLEFVYRIVGQLPDTGKKWFIPFILVILSFTGFSQEVTKVFVSNEPFKPAATGNFLIAADNLNFFKNNEYKSNYAEGYTLTGTWIRPKLLYYPDKKIRLELGGQVLAYTGRDDYQLYPWFSALYMPVKGLSFRMGNLNQDQNHRLPEPMMDSEHFLVDKPEAGIQTKYENKFINADLWIDWQKMILAGDPFKEQFVFGVRSEISFLKSEGIELSLPLFFNGLHRGGEIDSAQGLATTCLTVSEGFKVQKKLNGSGFKTWFLESSLFQSSYPDDLTGLPTDYGTAFNIRSGITSAYGNLTTGYWQGSNFYNPLGMPLYQNGAAGRPEATNLNRVWTFSYRYDRKIFDQSRFGFTFDLFYNPLLQATSNSAALYLMINLSFLGKKGTS